MQRNLFRHTLLALVLSLGVAGLAGTPVLAQDEAPTPDAIVYVDGLACPFCAYGIEKKLERLDGVERIEVGIEEGRVLLTFTEDSSPTKDELQQAVKKAGFTARKIEFTDGSASESALL